MKRSRAMRGQRTMGVTGTALGLVLLVAPASLANVPITTVAQDPYTNTTAYHKTMVEPDTFSFGRTIVGVSQTGRFADGGADNISWMTSSDNGTTWTSGELPSTTVYASPPGPWDRISDPSVAYDPQDNVWIITGLAITGATPKAVLVSRSVDGGLTWQAPVTVSQGGGSKLYDKTWIACDTTAGSPFYGNCYEEWDDANAGGKLLMSRSTDGGITWTPSMLPRAFGCCGQPVVQPDGTVVMPYTGHGLQSLVSTNGGVSYTGPFNIDMMQTHGATGMRDGSGLASAEVDGGGTVYVAWTDCRFRTGCQADDVVFSSSTNGTTWTVPARIPLAPTNSEVEFFLAGIGVDHATQGATAHLGVVFYALQTNSCDSGSCRIIAGFTSSTNAGATWSPFTKMFGPIRQTWLPDASGFFLGDYISSSFGSNGKSYPLIPNALFTGSSCVLGNITSCDEHMVAPTNGLVVTGGTLPVGRIVVGSSSRSEGHLGTAY